MAERGLTDSAIELQDVVKEYVSHGEVVQAVKGVTLAVGEGEFFSLLGPSGCGKTTTMRMSNKLDFGVVWVNTHIPFVSEMPHGGFKHSGYGKDLSVFGLHDYTRVKHVMHYIGE